MQLPRERGQLKAGEPVFIPLVRYTNNRSAEAVETNRCCGCRFEHTMVYRVILSTHKEPKWYLSVSAYPIENTRPKRKK